MPPPKAIFFDFGDVLCSWAPPTNTAVPPKLFSMFRDTRTWNMYDCGQIDQEECFSQLSAQFNVPADAVAQAMRQALDSVTRRDEVASIIRELRETHPDFRVYAMTNISQPDYAFLRAKDLNWDIFDQIFTSHSVRMRKPELRFYRHVLRLAEVKASEAMFVDDKEDNIIAAKSVGFRDALKFNETLPLKKLILNALGDPVERARAWLIQQPEGLVSESDTGVSIQDNFSQMLIYEALGDLSLLRLRHCERTWNYFVGSPWGTTQTYPDDLDTTSYALKLLPIRQDTAISVLDQMAKLVTADGIIKVYFDPLRDRVDPTVCVNVVRVFYHYGRGNQVELQTTKAWIRDVLVHGGYLRGTRYYQTPESFLYFYARLISENAGSEVSLDKEILEERLSERMNIPVDTLGLAMRVVACQLLGMRCESDFQQLLRSQQVDGSFEIGWLCQYGKTRMKIGNRGLTTALAIRAIEGHQLHEGYDY